eukprot:tig00000448_g912.t1
MRVHAQPAAPPGQDMDGRTPRDAQPAAAVAVPAVLVKAKAWGEQKPDLALGEGAEDQQTSPALMPLSWGSSPVSPTSATPYDRRRAAPGRRSAQETARTAGVAARTTLRSHFLGLFQTFADGATEHEYHLWRSKGSVRRQKVMLPVAIVLYVAAVAFYAGAVNIYRADLEQQRGFESHSMRAFWRLICAGPAIVGALCYALMSAAPDLYRRWSNLLMDAFLASVLAASFCDHLGDPNPELIFYPLPPRHYLALVALSHGLVWIGYPAARAATSFFDFYGAVILTGASVPFALLAASEEDGRRRRDFIDSLRLRSELESVTVEREDLREMNLHLASELTALQRARKQSVVDLDSPLTKTVAALKGLTRDARLPREALSVLHAAVNGLLASGSLLVPDFNGQIAAGTLGVDSDTQAWLLTEIAPAQRLESSPGSRRSSLAPHRSWRARRSGSVDQGHGAGGLASLAAAAAAQAGPEPVGVEIFEVSEATGGRPLLAVSLAALEALDERVEREARALRAGLASWEGVEIFEVSEATGGRPLLAVSLAALEAPDFEHPGYNNNFAINSGGPLAILYNDRSPLESHHVAASWKALREPRHDFLAALDKADVKELRRCVIDMVLATDMGQHFVPEFEILGTFKRRTAAGAFGQPVGPDAPVSEPPLAREDARLLLQVALKACDIGHASKPLPLHIAWSHRVNAEFFSQGDKERELGIPVSPFMDRTGDTRERLPKSQIGFVDFVVSPLVTSVAALVPALGDSLVRNLRTNYEHWQAELARAAAASATAAAAASGPASGRSSRSSHRGR